MLEKELTLVNRLGLHARSASRLVSCANSFTCEIRIHYKNKIVSAKSIMELLMLAAKFQENLIIQCNGDDEAEAMAAIENLIAERFGEDE